MNSLKRFLSIDGWCPDKLEKGQIVLFIQKHKLKIGRVVKGYNVPEELESWKKDFNDKYEPWYIESLDGTQKYYPYSSNLCVINDEGLNVRELSAKIVEI